MTKRLSVSIPDDLLREAEAVARAQGKTTSELVRDALRQQVQLERVREVQRAARRRAEARPPSDEDVEALFDDLRSERS